MELSPKSTNGLVPVSDVYVKLILFKDDNPLSISSVTFDTSIVMLVITGTGSIVSSSTTILVVDAE